MCEPCDAAGLLTLANTVDHAVPVSAGGAPFPGLHELTSMCASCHGAKTARGVEAGAVRSSKPRRGCDADGNPLDPEHPWHGKSLRADAVGPTPNPRTQLVRSDRPGRRPKDCLGHG
ncbi:HNH endonuclease [Sphingomonas sp.]|uniref:HNH endonuclease n=1 Tax=Sphingomonas sp. TaxID=28214 RepID=UPI003AFFB943